jgi:hypothetical protein
MAKVVLSLPPVSCPVGQSYVTLLLVARASSLKQRLELAFGDEGSSHVIWRFCTIV